MLLCPGAKSGCVAVSIIREIINFWEKGKDSFFMSFVIKTRTNLNEDVKMEQMEQGRLFISCPNITLPTSTYRNNITMVVMTEQKYLHNCHFQFRDEKTFHKICSIFLFSVGQNHVYVDIIS